ncbi:MAG: TipAS antibiotic-recognition domain-containing protein [Pseudomonas sp.]|uniref:TipAS antibiotic-recognition domain-containing protein n=1 Tax=Pseudomonas sp. TaxID=306 RepID=UPI00339308A1
MSPHDLPSDQQARCRERLNQEQSASLAQTAHWQHVDRAQVHADWDRLYQDLARHVDTCAADDPQVQALIGQHYAIACRFYTPSREAYLGMALFYGENADMATFHNGYHPHMVDFIGRAIYQYAQHHLPA